MKKDLKKLLVELKLNADNLTKKDIGFWRKAWQMAINPENPFRGHLYDVYTDVTIDLHLSGCIDQRVGMTQKKAFKLVDKKGTENYDVTMLFESEWFKDFCLYALESRYWGYSLIQFNEIVYGEKMTYSSVELVPRKHVIPEYEVIVQSVGDDPKRGISYTKSDVANWCIGVGKPKDLGLLLKCSPSALSKKNMLAYWDAFGEIFGMPIRIGTTNSRDPKDLTKMEKYLADMGAAGWGLFPEGTTIEYKETSRGDAFEVYDRRVERANSELSKGILNQTMTIDNGSSKSQSETHLDVFKNLIEKDADMLRDVINWKLIPLMIKHGFPVSGYQFDWVDSVDWTPEQQLKIEEMLLGSYEIDPKYFAEKYNINILNAKQPQITLSDSFFV